MAKTKNEKLREQYDKLMDLFRYAGAAGYLEGPMPMRRGNSDGMSAKYLAEQVPILQSVAQHSITLPFLTIEQAGAWSGINPRTIRHHIFVSDDLPTFKPGGKMLLIRLQDLRKFMEGR